MILGFHPKPLVNNIGALPQTLLNPFWKKGVKNPKNFGKNELCFSWLFRFGVRSFSLMSARSKCFGHQPFLGTPKPVFL